MKNNKNNGLIYQFSHVKTMLMYFRAHRKSLKETPWPEHVPIQSIIPPKRVLGSEILLTRIAHSCVLIQTQGLNIITDPMFSKIAGPKNILGVKRVHDLGINPKFLPPIDYILLSHIHFDHWDQRTLKFLTKYWNPTILYPKGMRHSYLLSKLPHHQHQAMNYGDTFAITDTQSIQFEPAYHWSDGRVLGNDLYKGLYGSYVLTFNGKKIFFAGDTAIRSSRIFYSLHEKYGDFHISLLPIGAYLHHSHQHTSPEEAYEIHKILHSSVSYAIHYETFRLSAEKYHDAVQKLTNCTQHNKTNHPFYEFPIGKIQRNYL